jgi:hypothetical protein
MTTSNAVKALFASTILATLMVGSGNAQNLIVNGSFETNTFVAGGLGPYSPPAGSSSINNWSWSETVAPYPAAVRLLSQDIDFGNAVGGKAANTGTYAVSLEGATSSISQTITLAAGQYQLSFDASYWLPAFTAVNPIYASLGGVNFSFNNSTNAFSPTQGYNTYTSDVFTVTTAGSYELKIAANNPAGGYSGATAVDNVVLFKPFAWSTSNPTYPVTEVGPGILHSKFTVMSPRRMAINAVRVDTAHPGIRFHTTGRDSLWGQPMPDFPSMTVRTRRQTTRDFLSASRTAGMNMVVAVNAAPWLPWEFPFNHQYADNLGLAVSNGVLVCDGQSSPSFIVRDNLTMEMQATPAGTDIATVAQAVSGFEFVLSNGTITGINDTANLNPRTALGLSKDRRYLYILTIDGRRSGHSDGATHYDLGQWLRDFGAWQGINMDGGGSTTLFSHQNGTANLLNWPSSSERANGSNLGIYYDAGPVQPGLPAASWPVKMADWLRYRGVSSGQSGPSDDAAGDGIPNLLKYAWNIDPLRGVQPGDPNGRPPHAEMTEVGGSPAFRFSWRRNRQATGLDLFPEYSQTLAPGSWANLPAANIFQTGQDPVTGDTLHEARVDPGSAGKLFLRLRAQGNN